MKPNIFLRSTFRRPLQTLLLFLLIGLAAFGFISSAAEYLTVQAETRRLGEYYQSIGVLLPEGSEQTDVTAGAQFLADNKHIAYADWRRVAIGLLPEGIDNTDIDGNSAYGELYSEGSGYPMTYVNDVLFYGTLKSRETLNPPKRATYVEPKEDILRFDVDTLLAGHPEFLSSGYVAIPVRSPRPQTLNLEAPIPPDVLQEYPFLELQAGERYLIRARYDSAYNTLHIVPLQPDGPAYLPVAEGGKADMESGELDRLRADMELLHVNKRCMTLVSTYDMDAVPARWEGVRRLALLEGRWLSETDSTEQHYVCMVHQDFAERRGFSVGDLISLQVLDRRIAFLMSFSSGTYDGNNHVTSSEYRYNDFEGYMTAEDLKTAGEGIPLELEIVGVYTLRAKEKTTTFDSNVIYIPEFCMPVEFGGVTRTSADKNLYGFVLRSYRDMDTFMEETRAPLAEMGLRVSFIDNNAKAFWSIMDPLKEAKLLSLGIYSLLLLLALVLAAFLYLRPRQKEFAIMRALGLPRGNALVALHVPIAILGAASIGAGGLLGWNYALKQAAKTLADIQNEVSGAFIPPSSIVLAALCLSVFILLMLFVYLSARHISSQPVLALLHGAGGTSRKKKA